jgi:hypothetical protein
LVWLCVIKIIYEIFIIKYKGKTMKISEFTKIIRKVIREEVKAAVRTEFKEALSPNKKEDHKIIDHGLDLHEKVGKFEKKNYSKNPLLNNLLNETAQTPIPTMNGATYTSKDAVGGIRSKFAAAMDPNKDFGGAPSAQEMIPDDKKHVQVPDYIQNALTKDYSGVVKEMNKTSRR